MHSFITDSPKNGKVWLRLDKIYLKYSCGDQINDK